MAYLILKDLLLQRTMMLLAFAYVLLFAFAFQSMGDEGQLVAIISMVGYMFVMVGGAWEEKNNSDTLWNSMPAPKWKIVGAKYLAIPVYVAFVTLVYAVVSSAISLLQIPITTAPINVFVAALGTIGVFVAASLYYPVYFAFGYTKSRYWHFILIFGIVALSSMLPNLFPEKPAWIDPLFEKLPKLTGDAMFLVVAICFVALLVAVSFLLSLRFYGRREF